MRLYFKQRFFSWLDSYDIFDENGNTVFTVEGQLSGAQAGDLQCRRRGSRDGEGRSS